MWSQLKWSWSTKVNANHPIKEQGVHRSVIVSKLWAITMFRYSEILFALLNKHVCNITDGVNYFTRYKSVLQLNQNMVCTLWFSRLLGRKSNIFESLVYSIALFN